jgi:hypothetical protein
LRAAASSGGLLAFEPKLITNLALNEQWNERSNLGICERTAGALDRRFDHLRRRSRELTAEVGLGDGKLLEFGILNHKRMLPEPAG